MHGSQDILLGRLAHGILRIVRKRDHVLPLVAKVTIQIRRHVLDVVDAAAELASLSEVVDTDE